jgi:hypothetical protein
MVTSIEPRHRIFSRGKNKQTTPPYKEPTSLPEEVCSTGCSIRNCSLISGPSKVFHYLTVRTAFASLTALLITLMIGPLMIEKLREFQISQYVREYGPKDHQKKTGTPTMGGLLICIAIIWPTPFVGGPVESLV